MSHTALGLDLAGCRVEEVIGRGGMGVIYRGTDLRLGRPVAIKLIAAEHAADASVRRRFEREARLMAAIDHPNVIPVYAAGEQEGHLFLVMRYVPGTDLHAVLQRRGRLVPAEAARIVAQVADALDAAHACGLVHRDIKPANVLIAGAHAYLTDFGITRAVESRTRITEINEWVGTVDFMSPEHLRGEAADVRSDVYSLGCLLFTCLTGSPPFSRGIAPATILAHMTERPPAASRTQGVPRRFDAIIGRALAKRPADRYRSAGDLGRAALAAADVQWFSTRRRRRRAEAAIRGQAGADRTRPRGDDDQAAGIGAAFRKRDDAAGDQLGRDNPNRDGVPAPRDDREEATAVVLPLRDSTDVSTSQSSPDDGDPAASSSNAQPARTRVWLTRSTSRLYGARSSRSTKRSPRRRRRLGAVAVIVLLATLVAIAISAGGTPAAGPLSAAEVTGAAQAFAGAYGHRNARAMAHVLAVDVERVTPAVVEHGRVAVLDDYLQQFRHTAIRGYELRHVEVTSGWVGRLAARYTVLLAGGGALTGDVVFGMQRSDGRAVIGLITTQPSG